MTPHKTKIGNGNLQVPLTGKTYFVVTGGPYRIKPRNFRGVKMAEEISAHCDVNIPTRDYQVPSLTQLNAGLSDAIRLLGAGEPLYVGCVGGMGRTGLFLAVLVKVFGVKNPVEYVRKHYYSHAVENDKQYDFVSQFKPTASLKFQVGVLKTLGAVQFWKNGSLTKLPLTNEN